MSETTLSTLELTQLIGTKITDLFNEHLEAVKKCDYDQKIKDKFSALITELKSEFADVYDELQQKIDDHIGELVDYKSQLLSDWLWKAMDGKISTECDMEADRILEM
jgi:hypothetical protein